jgi:uronate dehydrogenase
MGDRAQREHRGRDQSLGGSPQSWHETYRIREFESRDRHVSKNRTVRRHFARTPARPDGRYGFSKALGEDLASLFAYKHGISAMCIRIGSAFPAPKNERMLSTWMSYRDLAHLVRVGLEAEYLYEIVYGVSDNTRNWWDNRTTAMRIGSGIVHGIMRNSLQAR